MRDPAIGRDVATFRVDPAWPTLPDDWQFGQVASVSVDERDHVWVLQRPGTLESEERPRAAPPVVEFDPAGNVVQAWGGPGEGYDWPVSEHGIFVDATALLAGKPHGPHDVFKQHSQQRAHQTALRRADCSVIRRASDDRGLPAGRHQRPPGNGRGSS